MKLLLIDGNSIINRAYHALKYARLTDSEGNDTGAVFGFFNILLRHLKLGKKEAPQYVAVAFDLKAPTFRHLMYPEYKGTRKPHDEALIKQFPIVKSILKALGIKTIEQSGLEADDIIGSLAKKHWCDCDIITGDRDMLQLVDEKNRVIFSETKQDVVYDESNIVDLYGLDAKGVIEYKALSGDTADNIKGVEGIGDKTAKELLMTYGNIDNLYAHLDELKGAKKEKLLKGKDSAFFSRILATIKTDAELGIELNELRLPQPFSDDGFFLMRELGFGKKILDSFYPDGVREKAESADEFEIINCTDLSLLPKIRENATKAGFVVVIAEASAVHVAFDNKEYICPVFAEDLFSSYIDESELWKELTPILTDEKIKKVTFDLKQVFYRSGVVFVSEDLMLMSYAVDAGRVFESCSELCAFHGGYGDNVGSNAVKVYFLLKEKMDKLQVTKVYEQIELPLVPVLYDMERSGFTIDKQVLNELNAEYSETIRGLEERIWLLAGKKFNVNSPKQLADVLFDDLFLPSVGSKKSTSVDVLEKISSFHPIVPLILEYRTVKKLLSTYIEAYQGLLDKDGRVHTIFKQAITTTGRLSSVEPNLQNIPVRKEVGRELRKLFVASKGNVLVAADYSQIELRLLAHYSGDKVLIEAYNKGEDIHRATASKIYGVPESEVTPSMRSAAKTINFGIIYGMSAFGLSESLKISLANAKRFQEIYFASYPSIADYFDNCVAEAKISGYTRTLFGRIRFISELSSDNKNVVQQGERMAKNMPLQGSSADIIKLAMINVFRALSEKGLKAKLILQIHDELIIDTPENEKDEVAKILKREMENVVSLKVPLIAEYGIGRNWLEAKQ